MNSLCASGGRAKRKEEMPLAAGASVSARTAQSAPAFFMLVISGNGGAGKSTIVVPGGPIERAIMQRMLAQEGKSGASSKQDSQPLNADRDRKSVV